MYAWLTEGYSLSSCLKTQRGRPKKLSVSFVFHHEYWEKISLTQKKKPNFRNFPLEYAAFREVQERISTCSSYIRNFFQFLILNSVLFTWMVISYSCIFNRLRVCECHSFLSLPRDSESHCTEQLMLMVNVNANADSLSFQNNLWQDPPAYMEWFV